MNKTDYLIQLMYSFNKHKIPSSELKLKNVSELKALWLKYKN